jgi:hypothetical protein
MLVTLVSTAWAATCCGAGPPVDPGSLGPSEHAGLSIGMGGALVPSRWSSTGQLHASSPAGELGATFAARVRLTPALQASLVLPVLALAETEQITLGLGQASLGARLAPSTQRTGAIRPVLLTAVTAPPGVSADDLPPWWRIVAVPSLERQAERSSQTLWGSLSVPLWAPGTPEVRPGLGWELGASAGPRGEWGTCTVGLGARGTTPGWVSGQPAGMGSTAPIVQLGSAWPLGESTRLLASTTLMPPLPALGRNADLWLQASGSVLRTW